MVGIKYVARKMPNSWLGRWHKKVFKSKIAAAFQTYIFNDLYSLGFHLIASVVFGVLMQNWPEYTFWGDTFFYAFLFVGVFPVIAVSLPYFFYALIYWPISELIKWIKSW